MVRLAHFKCESVIINLSDNLLQSCLSEISFDWPEQTMFEWEGAQLKILVQD